jgi:putative holliday junction resolvase
MDEVTLRRPKKGRIIALDYGLARIGIAISDETKIIATPLMTLAAEKKSEQTAIKVMKELMAHQASHHYELEEIIIGMPLLLSGKTGLLADEVKHFVELLRKLTTIKITTWDERLTTVQAERSMREGQMTRKKRATLVDTVSAAILLQSFLDHRKIVSSSQ